MVSITTLTSLCFNISFVLIWTSSLTPISSVSGVTNYSVDRGEVQNVIFNLFLTGSKSTIVYAISFSKCVTLCNFDTKCLSVSHSTADGTCHLNTVTLIQGRIQARYDTDYNYLHIAKRNVWHLVFRATGGLGTSVMDAWNNVGHHDDVTSVTANEFGCLSVDGRLPCPKHYRSERLDDFTNVVRVRYSFYTNSRKDIEADFRVGSSKNANESFDMSSLFIHKDKINRFVGPYNYASMEGYSPCLRRFYISQNHSADCTEDTGWMMVSDGWGGLHCCSYEDTGPYPMFLYSESGDAVNWNNETAAQHATVFAVFFKYKIDK